MATEYLNPRETTIVVNLVASVAPKVVFEFGVNLGKTARTLLRSIPSIKLYVGIDIPFGRATRLDCQRREVPHAAGMYAASDRRFHLLFGESTSFGPEDLEPLDAAFIDGDHSAVGVTHDSRLSRALLRPNGVIVWHDYGNPAVEVTAALDKLIAEGWPIKHIPDTWVAYMRDSRQ
jgi:predicted O-methyltransferase YrrM